MFGLHPILLGLSAGALGALALEQPRVQAELAKAKSLFKTGQAIDPLTWTTAHDCAAGFRWDEDNRVCVPDIPPPPPAAGLYVGQDASQPGSPDDLAAAQAAMEQDLANYGYDPSQMYGGDGGGGYYDPSQMGGYPMGGYPMGGYPMPMYPPPGYPPPGYPPPMGGYPYPQGYGQPPYGQPPYGQLYQQPYQQQLQPHPRPQPHQQGATGQKCVEHQMWKGQMICSKSIPCGGMNMPPC